MRNPVALTPEEHAMICVIATRAWVDAGVQAEIVANIVVEKLGEQPMAPVLDEPESLLLSPKEAAAMLGIKLKAFYTRVQRGQVPGVIRTGTKVQVNRQKLVDEVARCRSRSGR